MIIYKAGGGTIKDRSEFEGIVLPILFCGCYTVKEKLQYVPAMKMYRKPPLADELAGFDYRTSITSLEIPVYFINGESDYNCPRELVKEYCDIIEAPDKEFFPIPDAAPYAHFKDKDELIEAIKKNKFLFGRRNITAHLKIDEKTDDDYPPFVLFFAQKTPDP
ncbi:MAG: hypothetical protein K5886_07865 [Lachnospiraceae bacterium]|nr:hypothetical protein [Lachnospiraceae bacterium]